MAWGSDGPMPLLPVKVPGSHRWVVEGTYTVTDAEAERLASDRPISLGPENLVDVDLGCIDCGLGWIAAPARCTEPPNPAMQRCTALNGTEE